MLSKECTDEIRRAKNLKEVFAALENHYDLEKVNLSDLYKATLIGWFNTAILMLNPPKKQKNGS